MRVAIIGTGLFMILATLLPSLRKHAWWIRVFDLPRVQIATASVIIVALYSYIWSLDSPAELLWVLALLASAVYQTYRIYPYTPLAAVQVLDGDATDTRGCLSLMIANVLMSNRNSDDLLKVVDRERPDILLLVETNAWWASQLEVLDNRYPHSVKHPLPNTYGMMLFSSVPAEGPECRDTGRK